MKADRRDQKRNKKLTNQRRKSNIKSIWLGINARLKRSKLTTQSTTVL